MKSRVGIAAAVIIVALFVVAFVRSRPRAMDFCTGSRRVVFSRVEFTGQGRAATLSDCDTLTYLASLPKLGALPQQIRLTNALSFDTKLFDRWGYVGSVHTGISTDNRILSFAYFESAMSDTSFSFILLDSNAPPKLREVLQFLTGG